MNAEVLLKHFDRISDAPDAVPRLRQFILDLAVRGKLVEQDPAEESAAAIVKRIKLEKVDFAQSGEFTPKQISVVTDAEVGFDLPNGWCSTRLGYISRRIQYGFTASAVRSATDVRLLRITDIQNNSVAWETVPGCDISASEVTQYRLRMGDILIARTGGTIGKSFLIRDTPVCAVFASYLIRVQASSEIFDQYLKLFVESPLYWKQLREGSRGTGQPNVNGQTLGQLVVVVPPRGEQHRIVAKVDELMALCDRLEEAQDRREDRREQLSAAIRHHLNNTIGELELLQHSLSFVRNLPNMTARLDQIKQVRQAILNLAVRGRLVPQDPNERNASELLGKRAMTLDPECNPWSLPPGWAWTSLKLIGDNLGGGTPSKANPEFWEGPIPWVSPKDMKVDLIRDAEDHLSALAVSSSATKIIPEGSLLMVVRGMILTHSFPTAISMVPLTINQDMKAIIPFRSDVIRMLLLLTKGLKPEILRLVLHSTHGTCKLVTDDLFSMPIPFPPLDEQHRILAKVDELMAYQFRYPPEFAWRAG